MTVVPAITEDQQQECSRSTKHHRHCADQGGGRQSRGFWIHRGEERKNKESSVHPKIRPTHPNTPEQVNEPGTLRHSEVSGHTGVGCSHSLISATGDVLNAVNVQALVFGSPSCCTSARRRSGAPLLTHWVAADRRRAREFEAHLALVQNHRVAHQPVARLNSGYGTTSGV